MKSTCCIRSPHLLEGGGAESEVGVWDLQGFVFYFNSKKLYSSLVLCLYSILRKKEEKKSYRNTKIKEKILNIQNFENKVFWRKSLKSQKHIKRGSIILHFSK